VTRRSTVAGIVPEEARKSRPPKSWELVGKETRRQRRRQIIRVMEQMDVPVEALLPNALPPTALLHLTRNIRDRMHSIPGLRLPCERTIRLCKERLTESLGCAVAGFSMAGHAGAFVQDPARLVAALRHGDDTGLLCVGGDKGSDFTKLGITYMDTKGKAHFQALVMYRGDDDFNTMVLLRGPGVHRQLYCVQGHFRLPPITAECGCIPQRGLAIHQCDAGTEGSCIQLPLFLLPGDEAASG
jgi:hypothetical protein